MKIAVIGAGVAGLTVAHLLKDNNDVIVYESCSRPGGLIKCDRVNGHLYHLTGGHVFNTKRQDVLDFFWSLFDRDKEYQKANRNSVVSIGNDLLIPYPIENHVYCFDDEVVSLFINDLIGLSKNTQSNEIKNFEEFLINCFGNTLYELYFKPYNEKVWRRDLTKVPISWLEGKLPMPTVEEIFFNNIKKVEEKKFVHSSFYYAKQGGSQFLANRMAVGLNIEYNHNVQTVKMLDSAWLVDGVSYDKVVFCGNIKQLPELILEQLKGDEISMISGLESHGTTSVLCEIEDNPYSWIYMPSRKHCSHRIICTGNFAESNKGNGKMSATIEFTDYIEKNDILNNLKEIPFSPKYLAHHYEKHTYPIQDVNTRNNIKALKEELAKKGFYLCGRLAEWEYFNMDAAMGSAIDLCKTIK
jgi:Protoporphyrinogen oxidase